MRCRFVPKTHYLFTCGKDKVVKYWDADKFEQIQTLEGHGAEVWALAVNRAGDVIVTAGGDRSIRVWEQTDEQLFLAVTAKPSPDWRFPHGRNSSHLLCSYKLWVNGVPLAAGPGRIVGDAIPVDTFNLTALVKQGKGATIAIESYYRR
jgi:WD40 repeat protein